MLLLPRCLGALVEKVGGLMVEVVEASERRGLAVRRAGCGMAGKSSAGPSKGDGEGAGRFDALCVSYSSRAGVTLACLSVRLGEAGGVASLWLALLVCLDGEAGILRLELGRANGLVGRSDVWLICEGRRPKGEVFSGESDVALVGDRFEGGIALVGEAVGVVARTVAGDAVLFCRLKGDWRPELNERGEGWRGVAWRCQFVNYRGCLWH